MLILQFLLTSLVLFPIIDIFIHLSYNATRRKILIAESEKSEREKEINALAQMRILGPELLEGDDFYQTDSFLLQWLKVKNYDVVAAIQMAQDAKEWRIKNRIDFILNETILTFRIPFYTIDGYDKEGRPIIILTPNRIDIRKLQLTVKHVDMVRYIDQMYERGYHLLKNLKQLTSGKPITGFVSILDAAGLNIKQHMCLRCVPIYVECIQHKENYYPSITELIVVVNMNRFMEAYINLVTPLLSAQTASSIKLFGTNQTEWSEYLLSIIPAHQLHRRFGGTRLDF